MNVTTEKIRQEHTPASDVRSGETALFRKRKGYDRLAAGVVKVGGVFIIFCIIAILFVICYEVYPLFRGARVEPRAPATLPGMTAKPFLMGMDEYKEIVYQAGADGLQFYSLKNPAALPMETVLPEGAVAESATISGKSHLTLGLSDGRVLPVEIQFETQFENEVRRIVPLVKTEEPVMVFPEGGAVIRHVSASTASGMVIVAEMPSGNALRWVSIKTKKNSAGAVARKESRKDIVVPGGGKVSALLLSADGESLFLGLESGQILYADLSAPPEKKVQLETLAATPRRDIGITALGFLFGGRTLVAGDASGRVVSYHPMLDEDRHLRLQKVHVFKNHPAPVAFILPSFRDKGFITADASGLIQYHYATTGATSYSLAAPGGKLHALLFAPRGDGVLALGEGRIFLWDVEHPHPEVSWRTLFGKVSYEGYPRPQFTWQSTGGSDDFEPKLSLVPLIAGTLKGTLYAMLFAAPLALLAALYISQFVRPALRNTMKPVVEIMAALPSVVLGFLAALWLAPRLDQILPGLAIFPIVLTALILGAVFLFYSLPHGLRSRCKPGSELLILVFLIAIAAAFSFYAGRIFEATLLGGDYRNWLFRTLGLPYDQRNSIIVGVAMGFAVIPLIFTISEDSLSNVPSHLKATSLALGATPWQTALYVVLPTASPGIFSAIMIGFGRAVGETMIVLMATGNTPILDISPFDGFRALSANIAVELPEAPAGGSLYRVLFLAALILFFMTFAVNTAAEWIRVRLRERYRVL